MEDIKVSVITPCRNSAKTLARCLASVQFQTHQNWEIIAVNDGSSDQTEEILADYALRTRAFIPSKTKVEMGQERLAIWHSCDLPVTISRFWIPTIHGAFANSSSNSLKCCNLRSISVLQPIKQRALSDRPSGAAGQSKERRRYYENAGLAARR